MKKIWENMIYESMSLYETEISRMEDYNKEYYDKLEKIVDTHPISMDGIMDIVEQCAHMSDYGIFSNQICEWLIGICHNDFGWSDQDPIPLTELQKRLELSNSVIDVAMFWNRVLEQKIEELTGV